MKFRIADTFTSSLARLNAKEQKAAKTTAFDLQVNPSHPSMKMHRLGQRRDPNFWSIWVSADIRMIIHRTADSLLLCYVDHHDEAYRWADRRRIERHPKTGAAQLVEIRERVEEVWVPEQPVEEAPPPAIPPDVDDDTLLRYGVPVDWLADVRAASEDGLLDLIDHLPPEAADALLELAAGGTPNEPRASGEDADPFAHPDAQRRFRVMADVEALQQALEFPWERWIVFLHPMQRDLVERDYNGPAQITGSAGTGKTVVALHRAVHLARRAPGSRVLLTTFWPMLARDLNTRLDQLAGAEPELRGRVSAKALPTLARDMYADIFGTPQVASTSLVLDLMRDLAAASDGPQVNLALLMDEWHGTVDAFQLKTWRDYRDFNGPIVSSRISPKRRKRLWSVYAQLWEELDRRNLITTVGILARLTAFYTAADAPASPYDYIVVDEAQDIDVARLRFLAAIGRSHPDSLFFVGDNGQRIFRRPFSWTALGIDVSGRTHRLSINYRTSHQIHRVAERLLQRAASDPDGADHPCGETVSAFNGPAPIVRLCDDAEAEIACVADWLRTVRAYAAPSETAVFVRTNDLVERARLAIRQAGLDAALLTNKAGPPQDAVTVGAMHLAKGMEYRAVAVMACDADILPLRDRIETIDDPDQIEDIYATERNVLYVACTRAREHLLVTGVAPGSEFLSGLVG